MLDFPSAICAHCNEPIANRFFVRPHGDDRPEHLACEQRVRREAARRAACPERRQRQSLTQSTSVQVTDSENDAPGSPRSDFFNPVRGEAFTENQRLPATPAFTRFAQEMAYYRADARYLTVEKSAERCMKLSVLLTAALARSDRP